VTDARTDAGGLSSAGIGCSRLIAHPWRRRSVGTTGRRSSADRPRSCSRPGAVRDKRRHFRVHFDAGLHIGDDEMRAVPDASSMTPVSVTELEARYVDGQGSTSLDSYSTARTDAIASALRRAGWPSQSPASASEVASFAGEVIGACVDGHRDVVACCRDLADLFRHGACAAGEPLPPIEPYRAMANAFLRAYVSGQPAA